MISIPIFLNKISSYKKIDFLRYKYLDNFQGPFESIFRRPRFLEHLVNNRDPPLASSPFSSFSFFHVERNRGQFLENHPLYA